MTVTDPSGGHSDAIESAKRSVRHVHVPGVGTVPVPPPERMVYYAGVGALAVLGVVEWPLALVIVAGHLLADQQTFGRIRGLGEAMEAVEG
jgi:hypothetical protein